MKWYWFYLAAVLAVLALVLNGAPVFPVLAGVAVSALIFWMRGRKANAA